MVSGSFDLKKRDMREVVKSGSRKKVYDEWSLNEYAL